MPWNEPGDGKKDPWTGGGGDGPPGLEDLLHELWEKLKQVFNWDTKPRGKMGRGQPSASNTAGFWLLIGVLITVWLASGIYIVEPAERGVVTRFGAYGYVTEPGPHWHIPFPVEKVSIINVDQLGSSRHKAQILTQDENIVDIELTVQSRIQDPVRFLFQDNNPEKTLQDATDTIVREIIGKSKLDFILTEGRGSIADKIKLGIQALIDVQYKTGLLITSVNMQPAKPPEQVKSAFDDAIKAREDKARTENQADGYANGIVPVARGDAARVIADAKAYKARVIAEAEGNVSRFLAVLSQYEKAPEVTRERMYLDTMQAVLSASNKVIIDVKNGSNIMYLPLDLVRQSKPVNQEVAPAPVAVAKVAPATSKAVENAPSQTDLRARRVRP